MNDTSEDDNEISFSVKFLGRVEVVQSDGLHVLQEAAQSLKGCDRPKSLLLEGCIYINDVMTFISGGIALWRRVEETPEKYSTEKATKSKVNLFVSQSGIDILENQTKFLLYSCPMSTVSFCAVLPSSPKVCGFVAKHPAADVNHCYLFKSKSLAHVLVSVIGDTFRVSKRNESVPGGRDLVVEALRLKNKVLQKENAELKRRLSEQTV